MDTVIGGIYPCRLRIGDLSCLLITYYMLGVVCNHRLSTISAESADKPPIITIDHTILVYSKSIYTEDRVDLEVTPGFPLGVHSSYGYKDQAGSWVYTQLITANDSNSQPVHDDIASQLVCGLNVLAVHLVLVLLVVTHLIARKGYMYCMCTVCLERLPV